MHKVKAILFMCFLLTQSFAQPKKQVSGYLLVQYDKTIYDATIGNNPSGAGVCLQAFFNNTSVFTPSIELSGDIYLENDKTFLIGPNDTPLEDLRSMVNLLGGLSYLSAKNIYLSFLAGPGFIADKTFLVVKPGVGFFFGPNRRWIVKLSCLNIFNREKISRKDYGSAVFAFGLNLF